MKADVALLSACGETELLLRHLIKRVKEAMIAPAKAVWISKFHFGCLLPSDTKIWLTRGVSERDREREIYIYIERERERKRQTGRSETPMQETSCKQN